ncbi:MAG: protoglobin domain-containing protein, partial [Nitrospiraceae bacterium]|nr:protoglobin domain-containing protein [Nitrospiraceae bacterium]
MPFSKLNLFIEELGLTASELAVLEPYKGLFSEKAREFAGYFYDVFTGISDTRKIIEQLENPQMLKNDWANWFRTVFTLELDENLMAYLWKIGIRHVEVNLDQRYTNLGFSMVRKFCGRVIRSDVPAEDQIKVSSVIDRILDFCLLTETSAYIDATSRCDLEIIKGIADRIRNPITIIGGNLRRIQKLLDVKDPSYCV